MPAKFLRMPDVPTDPQAPSVDPYVTLGSRILLQAVRDVRYRADLEALLWLQGEDALEIFEILELPADTGRQFARREEAKTMRKAERGARTRPPSGQRRPALVLLADPGDPQRLLVAGVIHFEEQHYPAIRIADLPVYQKQFDLAMARPGARPPRTLLDHLALWLSIQARNHFEKGDLAHG